MKNKTFEMQKGYVSFETAKLLKEKGFDVECFDFYEQEITGVYDIDLGLPEFKHSRKHKPTQWNGEDDDRSYVYSAPTLQTAMKWLREKHHIEIIVNFGFPVIDGKEEFKYFWSVARINAGRIEYPMCDPTSSVYGEKISDSWEHAVEEAIKYCLENLIK